MKTPLLIDPQYITRENMESLVKLHEEREIYLPVDVPEPSDIMVFSPSHVGVVVEGGVLSAVDEGAHKVLYFPWQKMKRFFSTAYPVRLRS